MILGFLFQEFSLVFLWFPKEANFNYFFFIVAPITFFIFDFDILFERIALIFTNLIAIVLLLLSEVITLIPPVVKLSSRMTGLFTILSLASTVLSITIVFYFYAKNLASITNELMILANTDVLTKVLNRRSFEKEGYQLFDFVGKYKKTFALIILDVDFFKKVNDNYGHPAGDTVLVELSKVLSLNIRQNDILARYGGEEFALLLKGSDPAGMQKAAEHLREAVENHLFKISESKSIRITISLGLVTFSDKYENFEQMINKADKALYQAKEGGHNRVVTG
ncbi:GGDEF domain-containing protein [Oceanispirochaeta sp. M1]|uniref:GGDEF domain-containing protein n=2 Tax=Oceanispirochaeta TaxID=2035349 RepID=UPI001495098E|nr:GGDEF domain-containing protein [Oceanispirochaeta sp. M1]